MAENLHIEIVSPERLLLSAEAESVSVPGTEGYFTVMANHAPMMSTMKPGFVTVNGADKQTFYVRGGFAEVNPDGLTILAELARPAGELERAEIEEELAKAREQVDKSQTPEERNMAQALVDGWNNLITDAEHLGPDVRLM